MAKATDIERQIEAKRAERRRVNAENTAATQAAISARSELGRVLDEKQALSLLAAEQVANNKARSLNSQALALEQEIAALERRLLEVRSEEAAAEVERLRPAVIAQLWQVYDVAADLDAAQRRAGEAKSQATGSPYAMLSGRSVSEPIAMALEALGVATSSVDAVTGRRSLRKVA